MLKPDMIKTHPIIIRYRAQTEITETCPHCGEGLVTNDWEVTIDKGWEGLIPHIDFDSVLRHHYGDMRFKKGDTIQMYGDVEIP
jgi:hypothetical protein